MNGEGRRPEEDRASHREVPTEARAGEHLANERTFLAWVRTNMALISLGFVLARLGGEVTEGLRSKAFSIGLGMVGFGALLTGLAAWRYDCVNRAIEAGQVKTDRGLVWTVTVLIALLALALIMAMFMG